LTFFCDTFNGEHYLTSVLINHIILILIVTVIYHTNRWSRITSGPAATSDWSVFNNCFWNCPLYHRWNYVKILLQSYSHHLHSKLLLYINYVQLQLLTMHNYQFSYLPQWYNTDAGQHHTVYYNSNLQHHWDLLFPKCTCVSPDWLGQLLQWYDCNGWSCKWFPRIENEDIKIAQFLQWIFWWVVQLLLTYIFLLQMENPIDACFCTVNANLH